MKLRYDAKNGSLRYIPENVEEILRLHKEYLESSGTRKMKVTGDVKPKRATHYSEKNRAPRVCELCKKVVAHSDFGLRIHLSRIHDIHKDGPTVEPPEVKD